MDGESFKSYESNLEGNLYKLWNRMSSGSYHPKAVERVEIPKGVCARIKELGILRIRHLSLEALAQQLNQRL